MNAPSSSSRQIAWPSVITVISAAILIGAEVFGAAFAGGWALAILFGLGDQGTHILQAVLFALGVLVMTAFIRGGPACRALHEAPLTLRVRERRAHEASRLNARSSSAALAQHRASRC
ncbi:hypothetical protein ABH973_001526 [Bradyrhizobium ottawaense]